ncbi:MULTISPECIES: recombinase family protein [Kocuria]|uniref:recombinase family protein n=1 Tax=Kocuria TaxID=57493 RepID=UPI001364A018|nr:recombinase family protein [Kocuria sp. SM24M-10]
MPATSWNLDVQLRALTETGVPAKLVFAHKVSGAQAEGLGQAALMAEAREEGAFVHYLLGRLGRSLVHMVTAIDELIRLGVILRSLSDTVDPFGAGRFQLNVFAVMVEYQRALIVGRVQDGPKPARACVVQLGRKSSTAPSRSAPSTGCTGPGAARRRGRDRERRGGCCRRPCRPRCPGGPVMRAFVMDVCGRVF